MVSEGFSVDSRQVHVGSETYSEIHVPHGSSWNE